jgi:crotonobetainyl-CoA:carnitine CoA-transferase CaiB-like acyl-CoA transferase
VPKKRDAKLKPTASPSTSPPLAHLRVLDLTSASSAYCGKLLADLGAEVIKIEPPEGDAGRREAPLFPDDSHTPPLSLPFLYGNAKKKSVVLDLSLDSDRERFRGLAGDSDLILEAEAVGTLADRGLGYRDLALDHPALVMTSITGFGQTGPRKSFGSNDLVASALGGLMISVGDPEDPPVRMAGHQSDIVAATLAAASSLIALFHRDRTGLGQHVDISQLEVTAAVTHIAGVGKWLEDGIIPKRVGTGLVASVPSGSYRCRDGLVYLMVNRPAHWLALAKWIHEVTGNEEVLLPEFHGPSSSRLPYRELLDVFIGDLAATLSVAEMVGEGQRRHIAVTPVQTALRQLEDPHLAARNFFIELEGEGGKPIRAPGMPARMGYAPLKAGGRAPGIGEHDREILEARRRRSKSWPQSWPKARGKAQPATPNTDGAGGRSGALDGLRIVEFGTGLAAPWVGRMLAFAGAEVIKIESHAFPDVPRLFVPPRNPELGTQPECSPWFTDWSAGKRFVALDLRKEEGAELARQIVDESDAVIANYSVGVLEKLGLDFERLSKRNPGLVMLESSGFGESGPNSSYVSWGPNIEAASGLASLSGFAHRACSLSHFAYPDPLSASHGLYVLLAGLIDRQRTGKGQIIHLSQLETTIAAIGPLMLEAAALGREPVRRGNREIDCAPYGCFPCRGEDRWCVICVEDEGDWERLKGVLGGPDWAEEARFATMAARVANADSLESKLAEWTGTRGACAVMAACQGVGVAAGVVQNAEDLLRHDPQLADRGFFEEIPHFKKGVVTASGIPLGLTGTPGSTTQAGSSIGHDNRSVLQEIVGLSDSQIKELTSIGAIEVKG